MNGIQQIYTNCLAQGAYFIYSNGEAAVVDPLREVGAYLAKAEALNVKIKYIFETHFHADFVSGHLDLAQKTGAKIVFGPNAAPAFDAHIATDNEVFTIGNFSIRTIHTPGHTLESTCYLLSDENGKACCLFSGDTLFIGDVGRPDLAQKDSGYTSEDLAGMLFDSLHNKIIPLPDDIMIYPAHGAGSACGKNMSSETSATLGNQKLMNYALNPEMSKADFIKELITDLAPPPSYFPENVRLNRDGYESLDVVLKRGKNRLSPSDFEKMANHTGALILDTRDPRIFGKAFIPKSINIGLSGQFAPWVGALIKDIKQPLLIVCEEAQLDETLTRLGRVGYDHVLGYLGGGLEAWMAENRETDSVDMISADTFAEIVAQNPDEIIVDVRRIGEFNKGHIPNAHLAPLDFINEEYSLYEEIGNKPFLLHCAVGYRSMMAASILKARGIHNFQEVIGGWGAISKTEVAVATEDVASV